MEQVWNMKMPIIVFKNLTVHVRKFYRSLEVTAAHGLHRCRVWNGLEGLRQREQQNGERVWSSEKFNKSNMYALVRTRVVPHYCQYRTVIAHAHLASIWLLKSSNTLQNHQSRTSSSVGSGGRRVHVGPHNIFTASMTFWTRHQ